MRNPFENPLFVLEETVYILEREDVAKIRKEGFKNETKEVTSEPDI
jgi:hypothetical protein